MAYSKSDLSSYLNFRYPYLQTTRTVSVVGCHWNAILDDQGHSRRPLP